MKYIAYALVFIALLSGIGSGVYTYLPKVAYIKTNQVYNGFKGKAEYEKKLEALNAIQKHMLDSLKADIEAMQMQYSSRTSGKEYMVVYEKKVNNYERLRLEFESGFEQQKQKYVEEIWVQINKYIEQYGDANHYDYIYGADGSGSLMYAKTGNDISPSVIQYINNKYESI